MTATRPSILVLTYTPFAQEPRALKQVRFLKDSYDVTTAGFGPAPFPDVAHLEIPQLRPFRWGLLGKLLSAGFLLIRVYWPLTWLNALDRETSRMLGGTKWDVIIAHDLKALDVSFELQPHRGVIVDLHEYAPRQEEHSFLWRLLIAPYHRWMCRTKVPKAAAVVTVSQGIADEYKRVFGFDSTLVVNATPYQDNVPRPVGSPIRLVHSGGIAVQRRLDIMIQGVRESSADVTLDLFLVGGESELMTQLMDVAADDKRIRFHDPVPYNELITTLNEYDIGLSIFPPTTFNLAWCLPNKFFDFIQARLGEIVGPSPEMARFVEEYDIGLVLPDFEPSSLARALESLTAERVDAFKAASAAHAVTLSSESQAGIWDELVARVLAGGAEAA
ncbi:glycosyltransferase [Salinibacterium sp.]|uniref:glycosyltransferase n=1 Tax=Salinibacterium sp. TaxID=1915057 RepID=UPI00286CACD4|nr:glycosyltransferase [Salinibacterium sp.]